MTGEKPRSREDYLAEAGRIAEKISRARDALKEAERNVELLRNYQKEQENFVVKSTWNPSLVLKKGDSRYGNPDTTVTITIPFGVVQQQLADEVQRRRRRLVELKHEAERIARRLTEVEDL